MESEENIDNRLKEILFKLLNNLITEEEREILISERKELTDKKRVLMKEQTVEEFKRMKPFYGDTHKIPSIPVWDDESYKEVVIPNLIRCGAIPKKDLIIGETYIGKCRNAREAVWNGKTFTYKRTKFAWTYDEDINHFEDDNGYDLFVPIGIKKDD